MSGNNNVHLFLVQGGGSQTAISESAVSQPAPAQNNQYAKVVYFGMTSSKPLY